MSQLNHWIFCLGLLGLILGAWSLAANQDQAPPLQQVPNYTPAEMKAISSRNDQLETEANHLQRFHERLEAATSDLMERLDLRRATLEVHAAARAYYPRYLSHIRPVEPGSTDREKVAHNLIQDICVGLRLKHFPPETIRIVDQLQAESYSSGFLQWCAEEPSPAEAPETP
jgi:hypothetical protein